MNIVDKITKQYDYLQDFSQYFRVLFALSE